MANVDWSTSIQLMVFKVSNGREDGNNSELVPSGPHLFSGGTVGLLGKVGTCAF